MFRQSSTLINESTAINTKRKPEKRKSSGMKDCNEILPDAQRPNTSEDKEDLVILPKLDIKKNLVISDVDQTNSINLSSGQIDTTLDEAESSEATFFISLMDTAVGCNSGQMDTTPDKTESSEATSFISLMDTAVDCNSGQMDATLDEADNELTNLLDALKLATNAINPIKSCSDRSNSGGFASFLSCIEIPSSDEDTTSEPDDIDPAGCYSNDTSDQ